MIINVQYIIKITQMRFINISYLQLKKKKTSTFKLLAKIKMYCIGYY